MLHFAILCFLARRVEVSRAVGRRLVPPGGSARVESSSGGSAPLESGRRSRGRTRIAQGAASLVPCNAAWLGTGNFQQ